jgi:hypothetical protein
LTELITFLTCVRKVLLSNLDLATLGEFSLFSLVPSGEIPNTTLKLPTSAFLETFLFIYLFIFSVSLGGVRLSPLGTSATVVLLYQHRMINDDDYGADGGMRIGRVNRSRDLS